jgi:threonine dehydrogenase-like Zn-dependent dehydrogenase
MKASVLEEYGRISWKSVPEPEVNENDVLINVKFSNICGTDEHIFKGEFHPRTSLPLIMGHELSGIVAETGKNIREYQPGDKVVVDPIIWCGQCPACKRGHHPACTSLKLIGIDLDGGFAEFVSVPENMVYKVHEKISLRHASLVEVLSIGFHACKRAGVKENDTVLIWGGGKLGQCILQAVKTKTNAQVFIVDILDERLRRARDAYPDIVTINAKSADPVQTIIERTGGVDIAFEAVGHAEDVNNIPNPVRGCIQGIRGAGTVCVLGLSDEPSPVLMKELIWKEAKIISSRVSHGEFSETLSALEKGVLKPEVLITKQMQVPGLQEAFSILETEKKHHLKILMEV